MLLLVRCRCGCLGGRGDGSAERWNETVTQATAASTTAAPPGGEGRGPSSEEGGELDDLLGVGFGGAHVYRPGRRRRQTGRVDTDVLNHERLQGLLWRL